MVDTVNFNPVFAERFGKFREALDKAGIGYSIVSGYRSPEYQGQMYANHVARLNHQSLPYPNVEAPAVVAPAWRSFHNYGLASDLILKNDADYARLQAMAPQYGLSGIGMSDKGHIQLAGTLDQDIAQYKLAGWRPTGQTGSEPIVAEVPSHVLPHVVQPPRTLTPPTAGPAYTPTAVAAANPPPAAPKAPTFGEALKSGNVGDMIKAAITKPPAKTDAQGNEVEQKSPLEKLAGNFSSAGGQQAAPQIPEMAPAPIVQDPMMGMAQPAAQLYAATAAAAAKPLTWGIKPYGSNAGFQGTTLNATDYNG